MRRLAASDLLPERAGQPVKAWVHISLADLLLLDGDSALQEQWTAQVRERWAARRAFASETGSEGGAWLDGDAAEAIACDAAMAPIVTGDVNVDALEDLVRLCVELDRLRCADDGGRPDTTAAWAALEQAVIGKAVDLLSGPGGLASFLRRRQLGARLGGPSLPLDIGYSETIPAGIRNAVTLRDRHCRFPGGCNQPASACDVHHVKHKKHGGKTSTADCVLLCFYHHQIVIQCRCLSAANYRFANRRPRCMMRGMHPWTGLADDVRLGVLTEWVTAELVDEVLAECGRRDQRPGRFLPGSWSTTCSLLPCSSRTPMTMLRRTWWERWRGWTRRSRTGPRSPGPGSGWGRG